jgi:putative hydrolase of the HAD superfamily
MLWSHAGSITPAAWSFTSRRAPRRRTSPLDSMDAILRTVEDSAPCGRFEAPDAQLTPRMFPAARRYGRGLILDLDDTLYPRERFVRSGLAAVAQYVSARHGIGADAAYAVMARSLATGRPGFELQALCNRFDLPHDIIPGLVDVFRAHRPSLFLSADVVGTLRRLRSDGWALAILTNGLPSVQFRKIAALGLASLVDDVVYAEEHATGGKPSAAPFHAVLRALDLTADRCICVGDDVQRDIRGGRAVGLTTIRMARPGIRVAAGDEADAVIDSIQQLPEVAAGLIGDGPAEAGRKEGPAEAGHYVHDLVMADVA